MRHGTRRSIRSKIPRHWRLLKERYAPLTPLRPTRPQKRQTAASSCFPGRQGHGESQRSRVPLQRRCSKVAAQPYQLARAVHDLVRFAAVQPRLSLRATSHPSSPRRYKSANYCLENGPPLLKECARRPVYRRSSPQMGSAPRESLPRKASGASVAASFCRARRTQKRPPTARRSVLSEFCPSVHDNTECQLDRRPTADSSAVLPAAPGVATARRRVLSASIDFHAWTIEKLHTPPRHPL